MEMITIAHYLGMRRTQEDGASELALTQEAQLAHELPDPKKQVRVLANCNLP